MVKQSTKSLLLTVLAVVMAISLAFGIFSFSTQGVKADANASFLTTAETDPASDGTVYFNDATVSGTLTKQATYWHNGIKLYAYNEGTISAGTSAFTTKVTYNTIIDTQAGKNWAPKTNAISGLLLQQHVITIYIPAGADLEVKFWNTTTGSAPDSAFVVYYGASDTTVSSSDSNPVAFNSAYTNSNYKTYSNMTKLSLSDALTQDEDTGLFTLSHTNTTESAQFVKVIYPSGGTGSGKVFVYKSISIVEDVTKHNVTFDENSGVANQKVNEGSEFELPEPSRDHYNFTGWVGSDGNTYQAGDKVTINEDMSFTAKWEEMTKYTVSFDSNGGNTVEAKTWYEDQDAPSLPTPTREGFVFVAWFNGSEQVSALDKDLDGEKLTAKWKKVAEVASLSYSAAAVGFGNSWASTDVVTYGNIEHTLNTGGHDNGLDSTMPLIKLDKNSSMTIKIPEGVVGGYIRVTAALYNTSKTGTDLMISGNGASATLALSGETDVENATSVDTYDSVTGTLNNITSGTYTLAPTSNQQNIFIIAVEVSALAGVDECFVTVNGTSVETYEGAKLADVDLSSIAPQGYELVGFMNANQEVLANDTAVENGAEYTAIFGKASVVKGASILLSTTADNTGIRFAGRFEVLGDYDPLEIANKFGLTFGIKLVRGDNKQNITTFDNAKLKSTLDAETNKLYVNFTVTIIGEAGSLKNTEITASTLVNGEVTSTQAEASTAKGVADKFIAWCIEKGTPLNEDQLQMLSDSYGADVSQKDAE